MKVNIFLTVIAILMAMLIGYYAFFIAEDDTNDVVCGIASSICFAATLIPTMGLQYESERLGVNIRMCSILFFLLFLVCHFCFAGFGVKMPHYIIVNGIMLLTFLAILYKMQGMNRV